MAKRELSLFEAIRIEGGLFPSAMLEAVRSGKLNHTADSDYGIPKGLRLRDEIGRAFRMALPLWQEFQTLAQRTDRSETQQIELWHQPLLRTILGFTDLRSVSAYQVGERLFPIGREALGGALPIVFIGAAEEIDKSDARFGHEGRRRSPAGLMQEYLNAQDGALYGMVCNGRTLRLYRDNHSLTRPAWLEVDLERLFSEELYADFALMYQLLHASRFVPGGGGASSSILELWREEAHESGERAVENLRLGVTAAIQELANGFLAHPANQQLRAAIESGALDVKGDFQLQLLRLVYRIIFLSTAEDRGLLLDPQAPIAIVQRYQAGYSIAVLREKAQRRLRLDDFSDCWQQLVVLFESVATGEEHLGLPALGGLFAAQQCAALDSASLANRSLLTALHHLCFFRQGSTLARINYRDMDSEELGSVYESLLELVPQIAFEARPWRFTFAGSGDESKGNARKLSGSYYTPDSLVQELIKSALEPVMKSALAKRPDNPRAALLEMKVIDPACGSGHFLLAASRRIAAELARVDTAPDQPTEMQYRHALREVIAHCIYGVDLNPMAIELTRMALWLEALEPGKPLGFLDAHIRCGNALVGVLDPKIVEQGIADDAFKRMTGDDNAVCTSLKGTNRQYALQLISESAQGIAQTLSQFGPLSMEYTMSLRKRQFSLQESLFGEQTMSFELPAMDDFDEMQENTLADIAQKQKRWHDYQSSEGYCNNRLLMDAIIAPFFIVKIAENMERCPTNADIIALINGQKIPMSKSKIVREIASDNHFFHWPLEFPEITKKGGFDCVLGNPPWEVSQLSESEFFASRLPSISILAGAKRKMAIDDLQQANPMVWNEYATVKTSFEGANAFYRASGRFDKTAVGKVNLYSLFAELFSQLISQYGRAGAIVPSGIATDDSTKAFFDYVSQNGQLVSLIDFENREKLFKAVDSRMKFCCFTLGKSAQAQFAFFLTNTAQLHDSRRHFTLTPSEVVLLNPNTKTCPVFRSQFDAELTKKIYRAAPVLIDENKPDGNPWGIKFSQGLFNMTSDSNLFKTHQELLGQGGELAGGCFVVGSERYMPLYEAKMVHQYDHRWAAYETNGTDSHDFPLEHKQNPHATALPRYWVAQPQVTAALEAKKWERQWLLGWRDITNATNERTVIAAVIPIAAVGHTFPCFLPRDNTLERDVCFLANINTIVLDFIARQKVGGTHLTYGYLKQFPFLAPSQYSEADIAFITPRVLELTYTAHDLAPFARDLGYAGEPFGFDPQRRALLRAELDGYYARLYGLSRDELRYILDPADLLGPDYPSETFRVLKNKELKEFGEYRTQRLVLQAWDRLERGENL